MEVLLSQLRQVCVGTLSSQVPGLINIEFSIAPSVGPHLKQFSLLLCASSKNYKLAITCQ